MTVRGSQTPAGLIRVRRQKPKRTINRATQDPEVALVKREHVERVLAVRQHDVGYVGETYTPKR